MINYSTSKHQSCSGQDSGIESTVWIFQLSKTKTKKTRMQQKPILKLKKKRIKAKIPTILTTFVCTHTPLWCPLGVNGSTAGVDIEKVMAYETILHNPLEMTSLDDYLWITEVNWGTTALKRCPFFFSNNQEKFQKKGRMLAPTGTTKVLLWMWITHRNPIRLHYPHHSS